MLQLFLFISKEREEWQTISRNTRSVLLHIITTQPNDKKDNIIFSNVNKNKTKQKQKQKQTNKT